MSTPATAIAAGTWQLDPAATTVTVTAKKLFKRVTVPATIAVTSGSIQIGEDGACELVSVSADAGSYDSGNAKRDHEVLGAGFLDADQHPTIEFDAGAASAGEPVSGSVTVAGTTAPFAFDVTHISVDGDAGTFTASGAIDRHAVGIGKLPNFVIAPELVISVEARASRAA